MREIKSVSEFNSIARQGKPVLLDFYADWCGPCQTQLPIVDRLSEKHKENFIIAKVNVDKNPSLAQQFGIRSIPALFFIKEKKIQERLTGLQTEAALENKIKAYSDAA